MNTSTETLREKWKRWCYTNRAEIRKGVPDLRKTLFFRNVFTIEHTDTLPDPHHHN